MTRIKSLNCLKWLAQKLDIVNSKFIYSYLHLYFFLFINSIIDLIMCNVLLLFHTDNLSFQDDLLCMYRCYAFIYIAKCVIRLI